MLAVLLLEVRVLTEEEFCYMIKRIDSQFGLFLSNFILEWFRQLLKFSFLFLFFFPMKMPQTLHPIGSWINWPEALV